MEQYKTAEQFLIESDADIHHVSDEEKIISAMQKYATQFILGAPDEISEEDLDRMYREDVKAMKGDLMFAAGYKMAVLRLNKTNTATPAKVISDEDIQRYITSVHPDTVGNRPLQLLMAEKIRISLEWMREQLTGKP